MVSFSPKSPNSESQVLRKHCWMVLQDVVIYPSETPPSLWGPVSFSMQMSPLQGRMGRAGSQGRQEQHRTLIPTASLGSQVAELPSLQGRIILSVASPQPLALSPPSPYGYASLTVQWVITKDVITSLPMGASLPFWRYYRPWVVFLQWTYLFIDKS